MSIDHPAREPLTFTGYIAGLLCALLLSTGVAAQTGDARAEELAINSGFQEIDGQAGIAIYRENVEFRHGQLRLDADEMQVHEQEPGVFDRAVITGSPVTFVITPEDGPPTRGRARRIEYDFQSRALHMSGEARLERPGHSISAETIDYNMRSEQIRAQRGDESGSRVRTRFAPDSEDDGASSNESGNDSAENGEEQTGDRSTASENGGDQ